MSATNGTGHGPGDAELAADVVGRALHALEPDEEGRVAEHLRECAVCRALLSETHAAMAALAHALPPVEPPPTLRASILAAAAAEPAPPAPPAPSTPGPSTPGPSTPGPSTPGPSTRPEPAAPPAPPATTGDLPAVPAPGPADEGRGPATSPVPLPRRRLAAVLALAAVVAGLVVFAARGVVAPGPGDPREAVAQRAQQVVASAEAREPGVRSASLVQPGNGTVAAVVLDDAAGPRVVPLAMPAIGAGRTFVLWRVAGSAATPMGALDPNGSFTPMAAAPGGGSPAPPRLAYALSVERAGMVPTRPSAVVASGPLV